MATEHDKLPGGCFVKHIASNRKGINLKPRLIAQFGFKPDQPISLLLTQGRIIITTDPRERSILKGIQELQFRQDEMKEDFSESVGLLVGLFSDLKS